MAKRGRPAAVAAEEPVLSYDEQIAQIQAKKIADHRAEEKAEIEKKTVCGSCGTNLGVEAEHYMHPGAKRETVECPKCERLNDVIIAYPSEGNPDTDNCTIEIIPGGYKWQQMGIRASDLTDKQIKAWYDNEMKAIKDGTSTLPFELQVLFRLMK